MAFQKNTFAGGEVADATEVNENFAEIYQELEQFPGVNGNLADSGVSEDAIAAGAITRTKLADQLVDIESEGLTDDDDHIPTSAAVGTAAGLIIQQVSDVTGTGVAHGAASYTANTNDNNPFIITEGVEVVSVAITPSSTSNTLVINATVYMSVNSAKNIVIGLFDGSTNAIATGVQRMGTDTFEIVTLRHKLTPADTSAKTYSIRVSMATTKQTIRINRNSGVSAWYAGTLSTGIWIDEIQG